MVVYFIHSGIIQKYMKYQMYSSITHNIIQLNDINECLQEHILAQWAIIRLFRTYRILENRSYYVTCAVTADTWLWMVKGVCHFKDAEDVGTLERCLKWIVKWRQASTVSCARILTILITKLSELENLTPCLVNFMTVKWSL